MDDGRRKVSIASEMLMGVGHLDVYNLRRLGESLDSSLPSGVLIGVRRVKSKTHNATFTPVCDPLSGGKVVVQQNGHSLKKSQSRASSWMVLAENT